MLITESQRDFSRRNRYLANINFISEQAMSPEAVPIMESREYGAWMIDLEDVISFKESNGYSDLGDAFYIICECNDIDPDSTIFSVDEVSIIANENGIGNLVTNLMNNGCAVVAKPVSSNLPLCMVGEACLDYGIYYNDWSLLEAWVTDDWDYLCEEHKGDLGEWLRSQMPNFTNWDTAEELTSFSTEPDKWKAERLINNAIKQGYTFDNTEGFESFFRMMGIDGKKLSKSDTGSDNNTTGEENNDAVTVTPENLRGEYNGLKYKDMNSVRRWIAIKIARLRQLAKNYTDKIKNMPEKDRKWYHGILSKIAAGIKWLTEKAHNLISSKKNQLGEKDDFHYDEYKGWRDQEKKGNNK